MRASEHHDFPQRWCADISPDREAGSVHDCFRTAIAWRRSLSGSQARDVLISEADCAPFKPKADLLLVAVGRAPVTEDLGKWTDWVFRVRWSHGKNGEIEVWKNGEKIVSDTGPNCGDVQLAPYFKFGIYKWPWNLPPEETPSTVTRRILVFDEIRIAAGIGGHALVKPPRAANK